MNNYPDEFEEDEEYDYINHKLFINYDEDDYDYDHDQYLDDYDEECDYDPDCFCDNCTRIRNRIDTLILMI